MSCPWVPLAFGGGVCKCLKMGEARTRGGRGGPGKGRRLLKRSIFPSLQRADPARLPLSIAEKRLLIKEGGIRSCLEIADGQKLSDEREQNSLSSLGKRGDLGAKGP